MKKDYKETIHLPITDFPMRAHLPKREPEILAFWEKCDIYQKIRNQKEGADTFILSDGPPYANARPHIGTALNKILKDIVLKAKTLSGYDAPLVPVWDCHGLPIELNVEKKAGKVGGKLSSSDFRQKCRAYAESQVVLQLDDFVRLGVIADWKHPCLTMDYMYEANAVRALGQIIANGYLKRGQKPVHWCSRCGSALAEAEVIYQNKVSPAIDVGFEVVDSVRLMSQWGVMGDPKASIWMPIWTTTPWTLLANEAVGVHPKERYAWVLTQCPKTKKTIYFIIAEMLIGQVMSRYGFDHYDVLHVLLGEALSDTLLKHPLLDRDVPVVLGDYVSVTAGTGNVHIAPAHGLDDYLLGQQYGLPGQTPVGDNSCFVPGTPLFSGLFVFKANEPIIQALKDSGHLFCAETIQHSYPHCWRHKTPLIFRATTQWFIGLDQDGLRDAALKVIADGSIRWIPSWGGARIANMVAQRSDWCISRQRVWGIPIPLLVHRETGERHPDTLQLLERVAQLIESEGVEAWFRLDPASLLGEEAAKDYEKVTDTLDVWFDSGVSHFCILQQHPTLRYPADLYLEGSDQHRGWFQSSLLTALAMYSNAPYRSVLTHGFVVDAQGRKMSKSLGNTLAPADIIEKRGADILRLWVAATDHTAEIHISEEILNRVSEAYRRIRNSLRFLLSNLYDFDFEKDRVGIDDCLLLDRWAIHTMQSLQQVIIEAYDQYRFPFIYQEIYKFCTVSMGGFYFDVIKDRLYTSQRTGMPRRSAQTALYYLLESLVRLLAPILSFTAEEVWLHLPAYARPVSVFLSDWYADFPECVVHHMTDISHIDIDVIPYLLRLREGVNKALEAARSAGIIASALEASLIMYVDEENHAILNQLGDELRFLFIVSEVTLASLSEKDEHAIVTGVDGVFVFVCVSPDAKCIRCWQQSSSVGEDKRNPELCARCVSNVFGEGEQRQFA